MITIASSTNNQSDKIKANIDKKFNVCQNTDITQKVTKKTNGAANHATEASLTQMIKNNVIKTNITVIIQSLTK